MNLTLLKKLPFLLLLAFMALSSCRREEDPDPFDAFIGDYNVNDSCTQNDYTLTVAKAAGNRLILVNMLDFYDLTVDATISGNTLTINRQTKDVGFFTITLSGTGSVDGRQLDIDYEAVVAEPGEDPDTFNCIIRGTR